MKTVDVLKANTDASEPPDLVEALLDLYDARKVAEEEGDVIPGEHALQNAERVLRAVYRAAPRPYSIYPMPDGDIAIDAHSPQGTKVIVMCDPDGVLDVWSILMVSLASGTMTIRVSYPIVS